MNVASVRNSFVWKMTSSISSSKHVNTDIVDDTVDNFRHRTCLQNQT